MTDSEIIKRRLFNQQIAETKFTKPQEIVHWMVAMQAQEYALAKWAVGLRLPGIKDADVEEAFNEGLILRTHLMRPTWHFVAPSDIRWMLDLTAPRVHAANAFSYRKLEVDKAILNLSKEVIIKSLEGGKHLTRSALKTELERVGISADGLRLSYIMMHAELEGIICSGSRQGKQFTYALMEERVAPVKAFSREEALSQFTLRYFTSRGPATLNDFSNWSGLTMKDVREGYEMVKQHITSERIDGQDLYFNSENDMSENSIQNTFQNTFLMPDYDEYGMSYKDRRAILNLGNRILVGQDQRMESNHMIVIDGVINGTWRQMIKKNSVSIETAPFTMLNTEEKHALEVAVNRYRAFIET